MAETSRSRVTITLGRSGQVVKRIVDSEPLPPAVGTKRSVRDRLGDTVDLHNKRSRGDNGTWNLKASNSVDDLHLRKDDLRFKIMKQKQINKHQNMVDLRDMLSRSAHQSTAKPVTSYSMHETRDGRQRVPDLRHMPEPRHERQSVPEPRGDRPRGPVSRDDRPRGLMSRDDRQRMAEPLDGRQGMPEPREVRNRVPKLNDVRPHVAERPIGTMTGQYASLRPTEGPPRPGFSGDSPWTLDHIRRKSPDRVSNTRGLSPQRRRAFEDSRPVAYGTRDVSDNSRPAPPAPFLTKQPLSMKSVGATPLVAPGGNMQRSQYPAEHLTVEGFLRSLGLEKYLISFKVEEVDMSALSQMGDQDLKELGIPMGPRKKILLALLARSGRQAR
ncbi:putative sterile alpha motif domain-containing protein [Helianthus debilis subsp. tardiflorus]